MATVFTKDYYKTKKETSPDDLELWQTHTQRILNHFDKVSWADAVLITNYTKRDIENYLGPNTLMEMGLALYLKKKIFLLNPVPNVPWREEILGMRPIVINGDLSKIT